MSASDIVDEADQGAGSRTLGTLIVNSGGEQMLIPEEELRRVERLGTSLCDQCGTRFEARKGNGGKPQRFCSQKCRLAFHAEAQRSQRSPTCSEQKRSPDVEVPNPRETTSANDFDWSRDNDDVLLHEQRETAVYINPVGAVVIRQRADWNEEDDPFVVIQPEYLMSVIDKLCDIAGIGGVGK